MKDMYFVLDINSGAVHIVDEMLYNIIEKLNCGQDQDKVKTSISNKYLKKDIEEAFEEINLLIENQQLFSNNKYEEALLKFKERETVVKALCLHIAHDCNLSCRYCFASEGEYHGQRSLMSLEVGKRSVDFLIENSKNRKNLEIDFFGGEPLMNFQVVKDIISYAKSKEKEYNKNFRFTITTNGVLLTDEIIEYINENMYNVVLSIDGRKEIHDLMRPASNGKGSYDLILPKFKRIAESREQKNYYVRGTFTNNNLDFSKDVLHLADLGFEQISIEPVVAPETEAYSLKEKDIKELEKEYEYLVSKMLEYKNEGRKFNFFHFMIDLGQGPCVYKRMTGCGAGTEYLAVSPEGNFYPCHQFVGLEEFKMGSVYEGIERIDIQTEFKNCHLYSKEACKKCWAKYYCGGGCNANAYNFNKDINKVYSMACDLEKKRVECAIYLKAQEYI